MWFKVEDRRRSKGNKFVVRCATELGGKTVTEERSAQGVTVARNAAERLASSLNTTATVYGTDAEGEFVFGVYEAADRASAAESPIIKRLYAESAVKRARLARRSAEFADFEPGIEAVKSIANLKPVVAGT